MGQIEGEEQSPAWVLMLSRHPNGGIKQAGEHMNQVLREELRTEDVYSGGIP